MKTRITSFLTAGSLFAGCLLLASGCASVKNDTPSSTPGVAPATPAQPAVAPVVFAQPAAAAPAKVVLKFVKVDSEETAGEEGKGANAVDGNTETFWHTQWQDGAPACPHEIVIEMVPPATIKGLSYLPRQDGSANGGIKDYEVYAAGNVDDFGQPVAKGAFDEGSELKTVTFAPRTCRFIKLKALSEINGEAWTSAAEINILQ